MHIYLLLETIENFPLDSHTLRKSIKITWIKLVILCIDDIDNAHGWVNEHKELFENLNGVGMTHLMQIYTAL